MVVHTTNADLPYRNARKALLARTVFTKRFVITSANTTTVVLWRIEAALCAKSIQQALNVGLSRPLWNAEQREAMTALAAHLTDTRDWKAVMAGDE